MSAPLATVSVDEPGGAVGAVVRIVGEIDMSNVDAVRTQLLDAVAARSSAALDLTAVEYLDTQAVRLMSELARLPGLELTVVAPAGSIAGELLAMTGLAAHMRVVEALAR